MVDRFTEAQMQQTAAKFQKLAALRGVSSSIEVVRGRYHANGEDCGQSVHGLFEWLDRQPGVLP